MGGTVPQEPLDDWLEQLGSSAPTPGGGAAAALAAAAGAALVEMVVNLTVGKSAYAEHEPHVQPIGEQARALRQRALDLVADDAAAFDRVMAAYGLPRQTDEEKTARTAAIQAAAADAARPPLQIAEVAARVIELSAALPGRSNRNVLSDVGVAASLAGSALESAAINVEVNLGALKDEGVRDGLRKELTAHLIARELGREVVSNVLQGVSS
ncbi:MAG: formiminotransferase-cyclodeaminase [Actinobacteria bacterium 13_2_20CM_2_71_6]|nr:MAG: formiminotransferase-cyclodeaminase [Actinobacteria bacterium 13_2_20CM_2_71_6]